MYEAAAPKPYIPASRPSPPAPAASPSATETYLTDDAHATDPAWLPPVPAPDREAPRSFPLEPTPPSDRRIGNCASAARHPADPSSPDRRPSSEPVSAQLPRTRLQAPPTASRVLSPLDQPRSRPSDAQSAPASSPARGSTPHGWQSFPGCVPHHPARLSSRHGHPDPKIVRLPS